MILHRSIVRLIILIVLSVSACATYTGPASTEPSASAKPTPQVIKRGEIGIKFILASGVGVTGASAPRIAHIYPHSPAEQAGLRVGDLILRVDDVKVVDVDTTSKEIGKRSPGDKIRILYLRDGKEVQVEITVADKKDVYSTYAEASDVEAQVMLGWMYSSGDGVEKNEVEAVKWYRKAAEQGNANGQNNLGGMYRDGLGVARDDAEAVKWYRKAAEQGNALGQYNLGVMYRDGLGVAQDDAEAVKWFRKAAEQGHASGQNNLGFMYTKGNGVVRDYDEAVKWFRKAAERGNALGQYNLGVMYRDGIGVAKDEIVAYMWFSLAVAGGYKNAQQSLDALNLKLNDAQLGEAKQRAAAWSAYLRRTEDLEAQGVAAEQAGSLREALTQDLKALQSLPDPPPLGTVQRLRERIIKLVAQLTPPPAIPEEAQRHATYAKTAFRDAKSPNDLRDAIQELKEALRLAPWWEELYYNMAAALEKREEYGEAARNLQLYLLAAPDAPDAAVVKQKVFELEFKAKKQGG